MSPNARPAIADMPRSGIRAVMDLAWQTPGVIHLEVGEPDFATPKNICDAAKAAIDDGHTRYTPNAGVAPLREAAATKIKLRNHYEVVPSQVVVAAGAVEAIMASLVTVVGPGDEILLPDPGWPNFRMMATLLGVTPVFYPLRPDADFLPDPQDIERLITKRTKAILINTPSNPLGTVIPEPLLQELYDVASRHDLWMISDECYDAITFDAPHISPASLDSEGRVIATYSCSKSYAMTGWRVGYAVVPTSLAETLAKVQEPIVSCVNGPAQYAAIEALSGPQDAVDLMRSAYHARRDFALAEAEALNVHCLRPQGAFYLWVDVRSAKRPSLDFVLDMVRDFKVAAAPGSAFGDQGEGWIRLSLANHEDAIKSGIGAVARLLN